MQLRGCAYRAIKNRGQRRANEETVRAIKKKAKPGEKVKIKVVEPADYHDNKKTIEQQAKQLKARGMMEYTANEEEKVRDRIKLEAASDGMLEIPLLKPGTVRYNAVIEKFLKKPEVKHGMDKKEAADIRLGGRDKCV
jgi:hypothetical protein